MPCFPVLHYLSEIAQIHIYLSWWYLSNHFILCCLFLLLSIFSSIKDFSNESILHIWWPKYWSFSFSISLSDEYSGLTSLKIDWFDFLAVQRTLKSLLQHHSLKALTLVLSLLYSPALTSLHDYWKNHNFDYTDPCRQNDVSWVQFLVWEDPLEKGTAAHSHTLAWRIPWAV